MKFSLSVIDSDAYHKKLTELLDSQDCHVIIDTNVFSLYYQLYSAARTELRVWVQSLIDQKRIKTPAWVLNEYTNRSIRDQLDDYFSPLKKMGTIQKEFRELNSFLKRNIDDEQLQGSAYSSIQAYIEDLNTIESRLESIQAVGKKNWKGDYKNKIHEELKAIFEQTVLDSDLEAISDRAKDFAEFRFTHRIPPGFKDGGKTENSYGDLMLWYEILSYCRDNDIKKVIFITNDEKKDWVYLPPRFANGRTNNTLKIADPRLVAEFSQYVASEDFYVVHMELLTQLLINSSNGGFRELARALQIVTGATDIETNEVALKNSVESNAKADAPKTQPVRTKSDFDNVQYSIVALRDRDFPLHDGSIITRMIQDLKSSNWYTQNPAIDKIVTQNWTNLEQNQDNKDKLFVLGRNVYQAACGGANSAMDFLDRLNQRIQELPDFVAIHLYAGMFYEIYFNSNNEFRDNNFKAALLSQVYELTGNARLKEAARFVLAELEKHKAQLAFFPSYDSPPTNISITFEVQKETDWENKVLQINIITSMLIDGKESLTEASADDVFRSATHYTNTLPQLMTVLEYSYGIPKKKMAFEWKPNQPSAVYFRIVHNKKEKRLPLI